MKMMKALPLGFLVLAFAAATALGCSRGSPCGGNECCSEYGYCGTGGSYCGPGCQSGPCYGKGAILNENGVPANACSGGSPCPGNECCSRWGYCGTGGEYCGSGCQSGPCYVAKLRGRVAGAVTDALIDQVVPTGRGCPTPPCPPQIK